MTEDDGYALVLDGISKEIEGERIVKDVEWKVKKGEHWAMLGPNGAGKTTLMEIITGYRWPT